MTDVAPEEKPVEVVESQEEKSEKEESKKERVGIVSDASILPESDDPKEIVKQVEFYFADSNLRFDKFLYGLVGTENKWVDVALVAGFNRMRRFKSLDKVKEALETSTLMELNDDKTKMRRKRPMVLMKDPKTVDRALERSLYAKGFGVETPESQFQLEKLFEGTGLGINAVRLRRDDAKVFKGSVFVEFKTVEDLKKFIDLEEKPEWDGKKLQPLDPEAEEDNEEDKKNRSTKDQAALDAEKGVLFMTKDAFVQMKMKGIQEGKITPKNYDKNTKFDAFKSGSDRGRNNKYGGSKGRDRSPKRDNRDWRERRDDDRKNGFSNGRGRGGRGRGGRGGRGGRDNNRDRERERASSPKLRPDGVPIVKSGDDSKPVEGRGLKRGRDRDDGDANGSPKKNRVDGSVEA